ncbi:cytochrome P450 [Xylogone sp. PMI_703]|nr:cytochrome P450 [Xylogone sp. PMI_703]
MTPIPSPPGLPLVGNVRDIDPSEPTASLMSLADLYGPIFSLNILGTRRLFISSYKLFNEVCDESRFEKAIQASLYELRDFVKDGLFTAYPGEHNWEIAHRTLMPAFGPMSIRGMFGEMLDIAEQLVLKWARFGPENKIHVTSDFTRLTLDSIALCAMGTRLNSFYMEELHPYSYAMASVLTEAGYRSRRPHAADYILRARKAKWDEDITYMRELSRSLVEERRAHPVEKKDLLNALINNRDPKTGEGLSDDAIINNMNTFLIAGHETTSGTLSFLFYNLLKNPDCYYKLQKEVDDVVGKEPLNMEHLKNLPYVNACLRETLRLNPPLPQLGLRPKGESPTVIGGEYEVAAGQSIVNIMAKIHRDPSVYGEDAEDFKPERMLEEKFRALPPNAWKPFGNGVRGCIGRPFAWQEMLLATAILMQNFDFYLDDPSYTLQIISTGTIKPKDFYMRAKLRDPNGPVLSGKKEAPPANIIAPSKGKTEEKTESSDKKPSMTILYGSNAGTCQSLADSLSRTAAAHGFSTNISSLDMASGNLPKSQPVIILTSSYEGEPPDNAVQFTSWLKNLKADDLSGVEYGVFGCGNHDWQNTYQKVPKMCDTLLAERGAARLVPRGEGDAGNGDVYEAFDKWQDEFLWPTLDKRSNIHSVPSTGAGEGLDLTITTQLRTSSLRQELYEAVVLEASRLTSPDVSQKRHIQIQLPSNISYKSGDYLAVLPMNPELSIRRALKRFHLSWDTMVTISPGATTMLPTGFPVPVYDIFSSFVELAHPMRRKDLESLIRTVASPQAKEELHRLHGDAFEAEVVANRISLLDMLERYEESTLSLGEFLNMLPPMHVRQYSISSSPLSSPDTCTLTYTVLESAALPGQRRFQGVASNYLSRLESGEKISVQVKPSKFHLPLDLQTPLIMVCAGTGIAPFRAFVEERALQIKGGRTLGPALLFVGCNASGQDDLYREQFDEWQRIGAVDIRYAFTFMPEKSHGCKYVQHRLWHDRKDAADLFSSGGKVYLCGSREVGTAVCDALMQIYKEAQEQRGQPSTDEQAAEWLREIKLERFVSDVFT